MYGVLLELYGFNITLIVVLVIKFGMSHVLSVISSLVMGPLFVVRLPIVAIFSTFFVVLSIKMMSRLMIFDIHMDVVRLVHSLSLMEAMTILITFIPAAIVLSLSVMSVFMPSVLI